MLRQSTRTTARALRRQTQKTRALHLQSAGSVDLLSKVSDGLYLLPDIQYLPSGTRVTNGPGGAGAPIRLRADRGLNAPVFEAVGADGTPIVLPLDILEKSLPTETEAWLNKLGIAKANHAAAKETLKGLWAAWRDNGLIRVSANLNPSENELTGIEVHADDFALNLYPGTKKIGDVSNVHPLEKTAAEGKLFYHKNRTGGNIACYGYGAGIAMGTMDALVAAGGTPANFLDGGGGATVENVKAAMSVIMNDTDADVIFVNSFGGITKMDLIAEGMVDFITKWKAEGKKCPPIVARLRGTGEMTAQEIVGTALRRS